MDREQLERHVKAILQTLGDSPEQVADSLDHENCYGWQKDAQACPVWHLLDRELGDRVEEFHVDHSFTEVWLKGGEEDWITIPNPPAVQDFIIRFDKEDDFTFLLPEEG